MYQIRAHLTYANVMATIALFLAIAGTSFAAVRLTSNSITSAHIKNGTIRQADLAYGSVTTSKVKNGNLMARDFAPGQLPFGAQGPAGAQGAQGPAGASGPTGASTFIPALPTGSVIYFDRTTCPSGWSELAQARGRYVVGMPAGGTLRATAGEALSDGENRPVGRHRHWIDPHTHPFAAGSLGGSETRVAADTAGAFVLVEGNANNVGASAGQNTEYTGSTWGTNAPYLQLLTCEKQ